MLIELTIRNLYLVECVTVPFAKGLNIISGETGAGKSALIQALHLVLGKRTGSHILRKDSAKGSAEAIFEISAIQQDVRKGCEAHGIEIEDIVIIRREIFAEGKTRAYINNQSVTLQTLEKIGRYLLHFSSQHAYHELFASDKQQHIVDLYGGLTSFVEQIRILWQKMSEDKKMLLELLEQSLKRERDLETYQRQLKEIELANVKPGEEEVLTQEFNRLQHAETLSSKLHTVLDHLEGGDGGILSGLKKVRLYMSQIMQIDPVLGEFGARCKASYHEAEELLYDIQRYTEKMTHSPERLQKVQRRLQIIYQMQKKYGETPEKIVAYVEEIKMRLKEIEESEAKIETLRIAIQKKEGVFDEHCTSLSKQRVDVAKILSESLNREIQDLNMVGAEFRIEVKPAPLAGPLGKDKIIFYLKANEGEKETPIKEGASGGELSRLMLGIQTLLSSKEGVSSIVFDEIDANVGGNTAGAIGEKLFQIAQHRQVISITHSAQIASKASHHICVHKCTKEQRTYTEIDVLDEEGKTREMKRLIGTEHLQPYLN